MIRQSLAQPGAFTMRFAVLALALTVACYSTPDPETVYERAAREIDELMTPESAYEFAKTLCRYDEPPLNMDCLDEFTRLGRRMTPRTSAIYIDKLHACRSEGMTNPPPDFPPPAPDLTYRP
jgi:hypothetical protein